MYQRVQPFRNDGFWIVRFIGDSHRTGQGALRPFDQRFYFPPCFQQGMAPKKVEMGYVEGGEPAVGFTQ